MIYISIWCVLLPFNWLLVTICWFTNPIACLFPKRQPNGRDKLWGIFNLWSTHDAPVDEGFYGNYFDDSGNAEVYIKYRESRLNRYSYRLKWLTRNTGYGWSYLLFSIPKDKGFQLKGRATIPFWFFGFTINDYNIGWKEHTGINRLSYAGRLIGLRKI